LEIDLVGDELVYDGLRIKTYALLNPVTRSRHAPPRESRNSFVARARPKPGELSLARQDSKCRILSALIEPIFDAIEFYSSASGTLPVRFVDKFIAALSH